MSDAEMETPAKPDLDALLELGGEFVDTVDGVVWSRSPLATETVRYIQHLEILAGLDELKAGELTPLTWEQAQAKWPELTGEPQ